MGREIKDQWVKVDDYLTDLFVAGDPVLEETLRSSDVAGLPAIAVSPNQGKLLMLLAKACRAKTILEIGTLGGYSTIWLARALPVGGKLITLEFSPKHAAVAQANLVRAGLERVVEIRIGPALDTLPKLAGEGFAGSIDFTFIDADKPGYSDYLDWAVQLSHPGSMIIADNVVRDGEVANPAGGDENVIGIRNFNRKLAADARVSASAIQVVGSKGYDGLAVAVVL